jgi:hypothetical protein
MDAVRDGRLAARPRRRSGHDNVTVIRIFVAAPAASLRIE